MIRKNKKFILIGIGSFGNICIKNIPDYLSDRIYTILFKYKDEYFQSTNIEKIINYSVENYADSKIIKLSECIPISINNLSKYIFILANYENDNINELFFLKSILNHLHQKNKKVCLYIIIPCTYEDIKYNKIIFNSIKYLYRLVHNLTIIYYDDIIRIFTETITDKNLYKYYANKIFSKMFIYIRVLESTTSIK